MIRVPTVIALLLAPLAVHAHGLDPAALALREVRPGAFDVVWRVSTLRIPGADIAPVLPSHCRQAVAADAVSEGDRAVLRWTIECGPQGLAGGVVGVDGLAAAKINALLTVERLGGATVQTMLGPASPSIPFPAEPTRADVVQRYVQLGLACMLMRPEHLCFVVALLMLVSASRRRVQRVLAFTLGHSLALAAATLELARIPARPFGFLAALSVMTLAVALTTPGPATIRRFSTVMMVLLGAVHGFGFAAALAEAGSPSRDVLALAAFNGGLELGQLLLVGTVLLVTGFARRLPTVSLHVARPAVYVLGTLSAFWCFERVAAFFG
jgi:hypothetical protein